jgi:hypothetical protein
MRGGVRPVDCFYEGENMLVIHPDECIEISAMPALSQKSRHFLMSAFSQTMSALPLKADMCGATRDVRYGPKADIHANHSITSSAVVKSDGGIVRPSVFAVFRLITNSNFAGCTTGRSAGFSPLRIRPA